MVFQIQPIDLVNLTFNIIILLIVIYLVILLKPNLRNFLAILEKKFATASKVAVGFISLEAAPTELSPSQNPVIVTKELKTSSDDQDLGNLLDNRKLKGRLLNYPFLMHRAKVSREKWFTVEVWIEFLPEGAEEETLKDLRPDEVQDVTYVLHKSFRKRVIKTDDQANKFRLWLSVWGDFVIVCKIRTKSGEEYFLSRYLDLDSAVAATQA